jgi:hypothetical protein
MVLPAESVSQQLDPLKCAVRFELRVRQQMEMSQTVTIGMNSTSVRVI